jgi:hypothetical protein
MLHAVAALSWFAALRCWCLFGLPFTSLCHTMVQPPWQGMAARTGQSTDISRYIRSCRAILCSPCPCPAAPLKSPAAPHLVETPSNYCPPGMMQEALGTNYGGSNSDHRCNYKLAGIYAAKVGTHDNRQVGKLPLRHSLP